jgi:hypothetical protein
MRFKVSAYERRVFALVLVAGCVALPLSHSPGVASVSASSPHSGPLPVTKMLYATAAAGAAEDSARVLIAIDLQARTVRVIGDIGIPTDASLAFCRPGGVPYTITNIFLPTAQLATLKLGTGAATLVGSPVVQALSIMGMTCSSNGTLYAVGQYNTKDPNYNSLYTVNRQTGLASLIGSLGVSGGSPPGNDFVMALAFAPDGTLYGANVSTLLRLNPSTGQATKVVDFSGVTSVMGLAIDNARNFYLANYVTLRHRGSIYALNITTGKATRILNTGLAFVHNIAFNAPG